MMLSRHARQEISGLRRVFRVLMITGARQVGKSTLAVTQLDVPPEHIYSLDDPALLRAAIDDPIRFAASIPPGGVIDEFQRAGEPLLIAIKQIVDHEQTRSRFILTGSSNYLGARGATETLAGRVGRFELLPLSIGERHGVREDFLSLLVDGDALDDPDRPFLQSPTTNHEAPAVPPATRDQVLAWILEGGFPEVVTQRFAPLDRGRWFDAYIADVINREALRPIAEVRYEHELDRLFRALAGRVTGEFVVSDLARDLGLDRATVTNYVSLLEALHLVHLVPAYSTSATTSAKKRQVIHLVDSGLAAHLTGVGQRDLTSITGHRMLGPLVETFVVGELRKQISFRGADLRLWHYRDRDGREVDVVIEHPSSGSVVGLEVKATSTPTARDARHLKHLAGRLGDGFRGGVVLHLGDQTISLDDRIWAVPIARLWQSQRFTDGAPEGD